MSYTWSGVSLYQLPSYINIYPEIRPALLNTKRLVDQLPSAEKLSLYTDGTFELECRLGHLSLDGKNSFTPGVSAQFHERLLTEMEEYAVQSTNGTGGWFAVQDWEEQHDYFYELPPSPEDMRPQGVLMRTTVRFLPTGIQTKHICKHNRDHVEFRYVSQEAGTAEGYDLRVSLNYEQEFKCDQIPQRVESKFVRIKSRKSYQHRSTNSDKPTWSIDFTKSWSGTNRMEAELQQRSVPPVYEVEVECLDPYGYMNSPEKDKTFLATSLLLKTRNLLGAVTGQQPQFQWEPSR